MAAMITSLDYGVGRITSALERTHQLNQTIIIFLSDNGGLKQRIPPEDDIT